MLTSSRYLPLLLVLCMALSFVAQGEEAIAGNSKPLRVYEVNKTVADFPETEDFSTPEAAYAAINRVMADGDRAAWRRISVARLADRLPPADAAPDEVRPETAQKWLNARIVEVRVFRGLYAAVLAQIPGDPPRFDCRGLELENGQWLNTGQDVFNNLEQARAKFARLCTRYAEKPRRPGIEDPDAYLQPFVDFLKASAEDPKTFAMEALAKYPIVIMGEIHHRPRYWAFNASLVQDPAFAKNVGTIYMELPANGQVLVDTFLAAEELDTMPVIEMLRDMLWMGWPDQPMLDFFVTVWKVNQELPVAQRLGIVLADMQRPWKDIYERSDWRKYDVDRDRFMADNIVRDLREHPQEKRNALFIVGVGHTMLDLKYPDGVTPMRSAGWHLRQEFGADAVYAFFPHCPAQTNVGQVEGRLCLGLSDTAFGQLGNKPLAFPLTTGPFGEQPFDACPDQPTAARCTYRDGYSAYLYLGPLEGEVFSPLIPGFYTDEFVQELDRRHRMMFGKTLVEGCHLAKLDAQSFIGWMGNSWGQPRRSWQRLGPENAWHYGDDWKSIVREKKHVHALAHPEEIVHAAGKLVEAIRTADYNNPGSLWHLDYTADHWYDAWIDWVCRTFRENPIKTFEFGAVFEGEAGRPTIPYKLILEDGANIEGELPFEYDARTETWRGRHGLDWHLMEDASGAPQ